MKPLWIEISPGELIDRITILQIKVQRMDDPAVRKRLRTACDQLLAVRDSCMEAMVEARAVEVELLTVNRQLWEVEDELRRCEQMRRFDDHFVQLARSVYRLNDHRSALKRRLDGLLGATSTEHKIYSSMKTAGELTGRDSEAKVDDHAQF